MREVTHGREAAARPAQKRADLRTGRGVVLEPPNILDARGGVISPPVPGAEAVLPLALVPRSVCEPQGRMAVQKTFFPGPLPRAAVGAVLDARSVREVRAELALVRRPIGPFQQALA